MHQHYACSYIAIYLLAIYSYSYLLSHHNFCVTEAIAIVNDAVLFQGNSVAMATLAYTQIDDIVFL